MNFAIASSRNRKNKKAVVWVSTVIYTLIGLSVIALLLAVVSPKISEMKDSFIIRQTTSALDEFDNIIVEIRQNVGSTRGYDLYLSRGELKIHCSETVLPNVGRVQYIEWQLKDSHYMFSEATEPTEDKIWVSVAGNIKGFTEKRGNLFAVTLILYYNNLDLTFNGADVDDKTLQPAKTAYNLWLENKGKVIDRQQIDISLL